MKMRAFGNRLGPLVEQAHHGLRGGKISGRQDHYHSLIDLFEYPHLAKGRDLIDPGVGARVRRKEQSRIKLYGQTIGHLRINL